MSLAARMGLPGTGNPILTANAFAQGHHHASPRVTILLQRPDCPAPFHFGLTKLRSSDGG